MRRLGCYAILMALALILGGGQGLYVGVMNLSPKEVTYKQFEQMKAGSGWFRINHCVLSFIDALSYTKWGQTEKVYIPVFDIDHPDKHHVYLLLATEDPSDIQFFQKLTSLTPGNAEDFFRKNIEQMASTKPIEGTVQFGMDSDSRIRDKIKAKYPELAEDFVILEKGNKPNVGVSLLMFLGGIIYYSAANEGMPFRRKISY